MYPRIMPLWQGLICSQRGYEMGLINYVSKDKLILYKKEMGNTYAGLSECSLKASNEAVFLSLCHPHLFLAHGCDL